SAKKPTAMPGDVYTDAPDDLYSVFSSNKACVLGPYTDSWGTFISAMAPVIDLATGRSMAVLGVDVFADNWSRDIDSHRFMGIAIVLLITLILLVFFVVQQREIENRDTIALKAKALEAEQKSLEAIFDSTQVGLLLVDSKLKVKRLNQVVLNMGGQEFFSVVDQQ
ncbi:MAG: hypothetical protein HQL21_07630, partial [Candidatus Omnitrophica bacterium]|nr:hypothetical protein [Candidatus Omnitrophota bacterium]